MNAWRFDNPALLWAALVAVPLLVLEVYARIARHRAAIRCLDFPVMFPVKLRRGRAMNTVSVPLIGVLCALSAAGPRSDRSQGKQPASVVIVIDVSRSMLASDVLPNRLARGLQEITRALDAPQLPRLGLIAFAGEPWLVCPLTTDYEALRLAVESLHSYRVSVDGTNIGAALTAAVVALQREGGNRSVLLLSDGDETEGSIPNAAAIAARQHILIHSLGIGTAAGAVVPARANSDEPPAHSGPGVVSRLNMPALQVAARRTGGVCLNASTAQDAVSRILVASNSGPARGSSLMRDGRIDVLPLALALLLAAGDFLVRQWSRL